MTANLHTHKRKERWLFAAACIGVLLPQRARADEPAMPTPIDGIGPDLADAFTGYNLLYYGGAVAATGVMGFSGADHGLRVEVQRHMHVGAWGDAAYVAGYAVPLAIAPGVYMVGLAASDRDVAGAGAAAVQALAVTFTATTLLKLGVGRPYPMHGGDPNAPDRLDHPEYAREFRPFQNGFGAWPSGHTSATTSVVAALFGYAPDAWWIAAAGYPLGLAIGVGMIVRDSHWASDVVSGALLGHAIGYSIGRDFRARIRGERAGATKGDGLRVVPLPGAAGVALAGEW